MATKIHINSKSHSNRQTIYAPCWEVEELAAYFEAKELPATIRLNECSMIGNVKHFITAHLDFVRSNNGNLLFTCYWNRLLRLKYILN